MVRDTGGRSVNASYFLGVGDLKRLIVRLVVVQVGLETRQQTSHDGVPHVGRDTQGSGGGGFQPSVQLNTVKQKA